jgi:hypothetical protein
VPGRAASGRRCGGGTALRQALRGGPRRRCWPRALPRGGWSRRLGGRRRCAAKALGSWRGRSRPVGWRCGRRCRRWLWRRWAGCDHLLSLPLSQNLLDLPLLFLAQLDRGPAPPAVGHHQPEADRHRRAAIGAGAENDVAVEPDLTRRTPIRRASGARGRARGVSRRGIRGRGFDSRRQGSIRLESNDRHFRRRACRDAGTGRQLQRQEVMPYAQRPEAVLQLAVGPRRSGIRRSHAAGRAPRKRAPGCSMHPIIRSQRGRLAGRSGPAVLQIRHIVIFR